jgi:hypothetical protein
LVINSDKELLGSILKPEVGKTELSSVWMITDVPEKIKKLKPNHPSFKFSIEKESHAQFRIRLPKEQEDNDEEFAVAGKMIIVDEKGTEFMAEPFKIVRNSKDKYFGKLVVWYSPNSCFPD